MAEVSNRPETQVQGKERPNFERSDAQVEHPDWNLVGMASGNAHPFSGIDSASRAGDQQVYASMRLASSEHLLGPQAGLNPNDFGGPVKSGPKASDQPTPRPSDKPADSKAENPANNPGDAAEILKRMPATAEALKAGKDWTPEAGKEWNQEFHAALAVPGSTQASVISQLTKDAEAFGQNPDGSPKVSVGAFMDNNQENTHIYVMRNENQHDVEQNQEAIRTAGKTAPASPRSVMRFDMHGGVSPTG